MRKLFTVGPTTLGNKKASFRWQSSTRGRSARLLACWGEAAGQLQVFDKYGKQQLQLALQRNGAGPIKLVEWDREGEIIAVAQHGVTRVCLWNVQKALQDRVHGDADSSQGTPATHGIVQSGDGAVEFVDTQNREVTFLKWSDVSDHLAIGTKKGALLVYYKELKKSRVILGTHSKDITCGVWVKLPRQEGGRGKSDELSASQGGAELEEGTFGKQTSLTKKKGLLPVGLLSSVRGASGKGSSCPTSTDFQGPILLLGAEDKCVTATTSEGQTLGRASLRQEPLQLHVSKTLNGHDGKDANRNMANSVHAQKDNAVLISVSVGGQTGLVLLKLDAASGLGGLVELPLQQKLGIIKGCQWLGDNSMAVGFTEGHLARIHASAEDAESRQETQTLKLGLKGLDALCCNEVVQKVAVAGNKATYDKARLDWVRSAPAAESTRRFGRCDGSVASFCHVFCCRRACHKICRCERLERSRKSTHSAAIDGIFNHSCSDGLVAGRPIYNVLNE